MLAAVAYRIATRRSALARLMVVPTAIVWLLFFPNAPYLVTDFVHLGQFHDNVPGWYDVMLIAWYAWTGLMLGVVSLRLMQEIVTRAAGSTAGWVLVAVVTALGSIGTYLGRFLRWNSWNVFQASSPSVRRATRAFVASMRRTGMGTHHPVRANPAVAASGQRSSDADRPRLESGLVGGGKGSHADGAGAWPLAARPGQSYARRQPSADPSLVLSVSCR